MKQLVESDLSYKISGAVFEVYRTPGPGLLEKVYENALCHELKLRGIKVVNQMPLSVTYKGMRAGDYFADMIVEDKVIVELKAQENLSDHYGPQLINYLKIAHMPLGLLDNFHYPKATIKRYINSSFL